MILVFDKLQINEALDTYPEGPGKPDKWTAEEVVGAMRLWIINHNEVLPAKWTGRPVLADMTVTEQDGKIQVLMSDRRFHLEGD